MYSTIPNQGCNTPKQKTQTNAQTLHYNPYMTGKGITTRTVGKPLTEKQAQILDLRNVARWSFRQIADHMGITVAVVHEQYNAARSRVGAFTHDLSNMPTSADRHEWRRIEESEFIDARIRDYLDIRDKAMEKEQYRNAVEALNGAHKYMETLIKLQGISAPEKREVTVTVDDLRAHWDRLQAEGITVTDAEVVSYELEG